DVEESQVRIVPVDVRQRAKSDEWIPAAVLRAREVSGHAARVLHEVEVAVAAEVHELLHTAAELGGRRQRALERRPSKLAVARVGLVVPSALFGDEHARDPLAVQIDPLVRARPAAYAAWDPFQAPRIQRAQLVMHLGTDVPKVDGRQGGPLVRAG